MSGARFLIDLCATCLPARSPAESSAIGGPLRRAAAQVTARRAQPIRPWSFGSGIGHRTRCGRGPVGIPGTANLREALARAHNVR